MLTTGPFTVPAGGTTLSLQPPAQSQLDFSAVVIANNSSFLALVTLGVQQGWVQPYSEQIFTLPSAVQASVVLTPTGVNNQPNYVTATWFEPTDTPPASYPSSLVSFGQIPSTTVYDFPLTGSIDLPTSTNPQTYTIWVPAGVSLMDFVAGVLYMATPDAGETCTVSVIDTTSGLTFYSTTLNLTPSGATVLAYNFGGAASGSVAGGDIVEVSLYANNASAVAFYGPLASPPYSPSLTLTHTP